MGLFSVQTIRCLRNHRSKIYYLEGFAVGILTWRIWEMDMREEKQGCGGYGSSLIWIYRPVGHLWTFFCWPSSFPLPLLHPVTFPQCCSLASVIFNPCWSWCSLYMHLILIISTSVGSVNPRINQLRLVWLNYKLSHWGDSLMPVNKTSGGTPRQFQSYYLHFITQCAALKCLIE